MGVTQGQMVSWALRIADDARAGRITPPDVLASLKLDADSYVAGTRVRPLAEEARRLQRQFEANPDDERLAERVTEAVRRLDEAIATSK